MHNKTEPKTKRELRHMIARRINANMVQVAVYKSKVHGWDASVMTTDHPGQAVASHQALKQIASELREKYHLID